MADRKPSVLLVTGGCGFIGSNFIRYVLSEGDFNGQLVNVDALTYAGNPHNLDDLHDDDRYSFVQADIRDPEEVGRLVRKASPDVIVHFAAESHVDRSILGPRDFITTNVLGTFHLLEAARGVWDERDNVLFHHVSTDEVYGSLGPTGAFSEESPYDPRSPYSASKASSDHLVRAYYHTYGLPCTISNCSNNYGPYQFPEKLIPLMIMNMVESKPLPVYGDGGNTRDWLYVTDHATAVWKIVRRGEAGETYNIGGDEEWTNIDLVRHLCKEVAYQTNEGSDGYESLIRFVGDRPGHDRRYAINSSKIKAQLGWKRNRDFSTGLRDTVAWYLAHREWTEAVRSGAYREWVHRNYDLR